MNFVNETELIEKFNCGSNIAYVLNDSNSFLPTEYKVLQSQTEGTFVRCMKLNYNGKIQLYYLTDGHKSLKEIIPTIDAEKFMILVSNLFADIVSVKSNGFLSCQNIDISFEHIIVDPATYKISLLYLPIVQKLYKDMYSFETTLRTSFVKLIQDTPALSSEKTASLLSSLSNETLTLENIYEITKCNSPVQLSSIKNNIHRKAPKSETMTLIAINAPVPLEIEVTKDEFILGRKQELADGVIAFNKMIGRTHCKIIRQKNNFAIIDMQSANGTYVNAVRLQPNNPCPIKDGDLIRLANCEFKVMVK